MKEILLEASHTLHEKAVFSYAKTVTHDGHGGTMHIGTAR
jgi:hypothetical protein